MGRRYLQRPYEQSGSSIPGVKIELLTPDFQGSSEAVRTVLESGPHIFSHNVETVERLYASVRFKSDYRLALRLLATARRMGPPVFVKTGIMVGLGEDTDEILRLMADAVDAGIDILTIGQYLRPTPKHVRIQKYYTPAEFEDLAGAGRDMGIRWVFSGPLVRSSYHAEDVFDDMMTTVG